MKKRLACKIAEYKLSNRFDICCGDVNAGCTSVIASLCPVDVSQGFYKSCFASSSFTNNANFNSVRLCCALRVKLSILILNLKNLLA